METSAGFRLVCLLLLATLSSARVRIIQSHFKAGGTLVLEPAPVHERITSILWKQNKDLLAEWVEGVTPLEYYGGTEGRSHLNISTGVLMIRNMTTEDAGVFSVEINNQVQDQVYNASQMDEVPQPEAFARPLKCSPAMARCILRCSGHWASKKAEDITYFWKKGDGEWEESEQDKEILNTDEIQRVKTFSCRMKNPVSEKDSKPLSNPFYREEEPQDSGGGLDAWAIWAAVLGGAAVVFALAGFAFYKLHHRTHRLLPAECYRL